MVWLTLKPRIVIWVTTTRKEWQRTLRRHKHKSSCDDAVHFMPWEPAEARIQRGASKFDVPNNFLLAAGRYGFPHDSRLSMNHPDRRGCRRISRHHRLAPKWSRVDLHHPRHDGPPFKRCRSGLLPPRAPRPALPMSLHPFPVSPPSPGLDCSSVTHGSAMEIRTRGTHLLATRPYRYPRILNPEVYHLVS